MSTTNKRIKAAATRLGIALAHRTHAVRMAVGEDETITTSTDLSILVLENIDFIIWAVKKAGGLTVSNPEPVSPASGSLIKLPEPTTPPKELPKISPALTGLANVPPAR